MGLIILTLSQISSNSRTFSSDIGLTFVSSILLHFFIGTYVTLRFNLHFLSSLSRFSSWSFGSLRCLPLYCYDFCSIFSIFTLFSIDFKSTIILLAYLPSFLVSAFANLPSSQSVSFS